MRYATILTALCLLVSSCTSVSPVTVTGNPYSVLTLKDPKHHHFIDDFRSRKLTNQVGGAWSVESSPGSSITTEFSPEDAFKTSGASLRLNVNILPQGKAALVSDLNELDVSQAKTVSFWAKGENTFRDALSVELTNKAGEVLAVPLKNLNISNNKWSEVFISNSELHSIQLEDLNAFRLVIRSGDKPLAGVLQLDHFVFSGDANLNLDSLTDNLIGFPDKITDDVRRAELMKFYNERLLEEITKDSWGYFENLVDKRTHLPVDHIKVDDMEHVGDYTSPTNIGLYLLTCVVAKEFGWMGADEAEEKIKSTLQTLNKLERWEGFFFNYYNTTNLQVTSRFISSVDNAWLAASLVTLRQAMPEIAGTVSTFINAMDFGKLYSEKVGHFYIGYEPGGSGFENNHYGLLSSESRIVSYVAIGKGDVEAKHWFRLYRTLPPDWTWQTQIPRGQDVVIQGTTVYEGYYIYENIPIIPSWGGGLFEFLMPTLLVDEPVLAPNGLGRNDKNATLAHIRFAEEKGYPVWGLSPCAIGRDARGSYGEFGVKAIGAKGYRDDGVVTPHVSFLALAVDPEEAFKNIRNFLKSFSAYGPYGLYDSVDVKQDSVCYQYLALDQGMTVLAGANYLRGNLLRRYFHADEIGAKIESLLSSEQFYPGFTPSNETPPAQKQ